MAIQNPVTPEQLELLRQAKVDLATLDGEIRRAKMAGIPVDEAEKQAADLRTQTARLLQVYDVPGR